MTCIATYATQCELKVPEDGSSLTPFVEVTLTAQQQQGTGGTITVGNNSFSASPNTAVVQSFEFGKADAIDCRIVIQDEQGGSFEKFAASLLKDFKCAKQPFAIRVQFGWIKSFCDKPSIISKSHYSHMIIKSIETNFSNGKFMYEVSCSEVFSVGQGGGTELIIGGDGEEGVSLRDAINKYLQDDPPPKIKSVKFCKINNGQCEPVAFEHGEKTNENGRSASWGGPKFKWAADGQDKLRTVIHWLEGWRSENKKSFRPFYNDEHEEGELVFWEDPKPSCEETATISCVGFYVVNGGKFSPVLEFNPNFQWNFARLTNAGGNMSTMSSDPTENNAKTKGRDACSTLSRAFNPGAGHGMSTPQSESHDALFGKEGTNENRKAQDSMLRCFPLDSGTIEADLVIIGDPTIRPMEHLNQFVSVAFVNPFYLGSGNGCGEWIQTSVCNEVLSNDQWRIESINHKIEIGKYTTTLKLSMAAPGLELNTNQSLGGSSNGWSPPPDCN